MKVTTKEMKENKSVLKIEGTEAYFVNSLRRVMLADLPKLAIDNIIIYDNTSPLFDEIIAHRLSLVPVPTDLSLLSFRSECACKGAGCPSCTVRYTLSKEGQSTVYSGDLQPENKDFAVKDTLIPIVELTKDQRIILEVEAYLGRGRDHAKWQSVLAPGYKFYPLVEINLKKCEQCKKCIDICPKHILMLKNDKLVVTDIEQCTCCKSCMEICETDAITVSSDENTFLFQFETDGSLSAREALSESVKILSKKYEEFGKLLKAMK